VSKSWSDLEARQGRGVATAFEALTTLDALSRAMADGTPARPIAFRDLVAWLKGPPVALSIAYKQALLADQSLRRDFDRLLARTAGWRCERAAAASSGLLEVREGKGFRVRLKPSRGPGGQVYLLIEFTGEVPDTPPQSMLVKGPEGECIVRGLPELQDGTAQILCAEEDELLRLMRDPKTEIFLW
jgi:hypothetical protein